MAKRGANDASQSPVKIEDKVLENLVQLQKVQVILAEKFDKLSDQISKLLGLFELAAKSFASNPAVKSTEKDEEFLGKINTLVEQNKTIAKGLTLMEERIRERVYGAPKPAEDSSTINQEESETTKEDKDEYIASPSSNRPLPKF